MLAGDLFSDKTILLKPHTAQSGSGTMEVPGLVRLPVLQLQLQLLRESLGFRSQPPRVPCRGNITTSAP